MGENGSLVSKVLVLDDSGKNFASLKAFYEECGLVGIRPHKKDELSVMLILKSNVDLGGIMLYENYIEKGVELAREMHDLRPELPIFLRRDSVSSVAGLGEKDAAMFRCAYTLDDLQILRASVEASIFNRIYPNELVRGITEMTCATFESLFRNCDIDVEAPYLVKDRIIYGEVFSLIAIESNWCRGYMMLQSTEEPVMEVIRRDAGSEGHDMSYRELNNMLGEATNMVWGAFKNRYVGHDDEGKKQINTQVPIIINHHRRFISFGSEDPQLCLKYTLRERDRAGAVPISIIQRFIFNLNWSPEDFKENQSVESLVDSGELEMF